MRKSVLFLISLLFAGSAFAQTSVPISALPNGGLLQQNDSVPMVRNGVTMKAQPFQQPTPGSVVISNGSAAPGGISPVNGFCLIGNNNAWTAGGCANYQAGVGLTLNGLTFNVNATQNITGLTNLTTNGFVNTSSSNGTLGVYTPTQATAALNAFTSSLQGLVPASGGGTTNFLRADGTFAVPPGTGVSSLTGDSFLISNSASTGAVTLAQRNHTANSVAGALTNTTLSDLSLPSCSTSTSAIKYTSGTGFGCQAFGTAVNSNTGTSGANIPLLNGTNTWSGPQIHSSTVAFNGTVPSLSNGTGAVAASSTKGGIFTGQGSVDDLDFQNSAGADICVAATGTTTLNCTGLQVGGSNVLTGNQTITLSGDTTGSGATSITTTTSKVNGVSYGASPSTNTVPVVTGTNAITYEAVPLAAGGTGQTTKSNAFNALSPMTTLGDIIYGGASGTGTRLAANATATNECLVSASGAAPVWQQLAFTDISGRATSSQVPTNTILTATGSPAQGDILYYNGSNWIDLAAGTSGQFLKTQGAGANPAWANAAGSGTVTSVTFTGDGTVLSSTPSSAVTTTGTVTASLANAAAGTVLGNNTTSSAAPSYSAAPVLGNPASTNGTLGLANGGAGGATVTLKNLGATSAYNFNLPTTAGSAGQVLTSQGGVSSSMTWTNPSVLVQRVSSYDGTLHTGTGTFTLNNTIPTNTAGDQYYSVTITPTNSSNKLVITGIMNWSNSSSGQDMFLGLYQDTTANALFAMPLVNLSNGHGYSNTFQYVMTAGTTSATTFKVRMGATGGTTSINGIGGIGQVFGGVMLSGIQVEETTQ